MPDVRLVPLPLPAMDALVAGDLDAASQAAGVRLTPFFCDEAWLWRIRAEQVRLHPEAAAWVARAALVDGVPVGHVGFHGPPDDRGMVEVAYAVDPLHRRRGHARRLLDAALTWASEEPAALVVRASVAPDNHPSLRTLEPYGFARVGEQWDDEDGLELLFERPVRR